MGGREGEGKQRLAHGLSVKRVPRQPGAGGRRPSSLDDIFTGKNAKAEQLPISGCGAEHQQSDRPSQTGGPEPKQTSTSNVGVTELDRNVLFNRKGCTGR